MNRTENENIQPRSLDSFGSLPEDKDITKRVIISRYDEFDFNPRDEWDHVFKLYSYIPRHLGSDKNAEDPYDENDDGERVLKDGFVAFFGSAYIHSGIALSLSDGRGFPDFSWDVSSDCFVMYTNRELYENMCGKDTWKPDEPDFKKRLFAIADGEVNELQMAIDGEWYKWKLEEKRVWHEKIERTENGQTNVTERDCEKWDETDGCSGYLVEKLTDIDTPRGVPVFLDKSARYLK